MESETEEKITKYLIENVFQNEDVMFNSEIIQDTEELGNIIDYLIDVIESLHNEYYYMVWGVYYDYMFHWSNKIGANRPSVRVHLFEDF